MSLLVVGSVAFDSVKTPFGVRDDILGGSATYFSTAASYFTDVSLVAVVGEDFPEHHINFLKSRGINVEGLERQDGKTFRWKGEYGYQLNEAHTLETHLNVFETFKPALPASYRDAEVVFLANIDPELQLEVLRQGNLSLLRACGTMNFWVSSKRGAVFEIIPEMYLIKRVSLPPRPIRWKMYLTRQAPETASQGASWATLPAHGISVMQA